MSEEDGQRAFKGIIDVPDVAGMFVIEKQFNKRGAGEWIGIIPRNSDGTPVVDTVKITFGTGALYDTEVLKEKIATYIDAGIGVMTGGTLTEVLLVSLDNPTYKDPKFKEYMKRVKSLGFNMLEFSDGSIFVPDGVLTPKDHRSDFIKACTDYGLIVYSEVGKKNDDLDVYDLDQRMGRIELDLKAGARRVILESREGASTGLVVKEGGWDEITEILREFGYDTIIVEAGKKEVQIEAFVRYGPELRIGNVQPNDVLSATAIAVGLRGDTFNLLPGFRKYHEKIAELVGPEHVEKYMAVQSELLEKRVKDIPPIGQRAQPYIGNTSK